MQQYGLMLTNNSKTGPAFSLPRSKTCLHKTETCARVCYGRGIRYQMPAQKEKRHRNLATVEWLLETGGVELLTKHLVFMIDQARPNFWYHKDGNTGYKPLPWTLRVHDVGDFYSIDYISAWTLAVEQRKECAFWFYTRSFPDVNLFAALDNFAALANVQAWLSVDVDNYEEGMLAYLKGNGKWKLALLQDDHDMIEADVIPALASVSQDSDLISFPRHVSGWHVKPVHHDKVIVCPQILGAYPLQSRTGALRPCQSCAVCLPAPF